MISPEEAERAAYIKGDAEKAILWAVIADMEAMLAAEEEEDNEE